MGTTLTLFIVLMIAYVVVTIAYSSKQARKHDDGTLEDWFIAGRKMTFIGVGLSMSAAWLDMATVFLNTGGAYGVGISAIWYLAGAEMIVFLILGFGLGKRIRRIPMISQPEMLEKRYSPIIRPLYSIIWIVSLSGYAALSFFVFQETFMHFFGLSPIISALICLGIVLGYQLIGGFTSVIYADYIQAGLVILGTTVLGIASVNSAGGISNIVAQVPTGFLNPIGIGIGEVGLLLISLVPAFLVEPTAWGRIASAKNEKEMKKGMILSFLVYIPVCVFTLIAGLAAYTLYASWTQSPDLIAIQMAQDFFSPVMSAVVLVGIMAALISSFSAFMFAANMTLTYDFIPDVYRRITGKIIAESNYRKLNRMGLVVIGLLASYIAVKMPSLLDILLFSGSIAGSGIFFPVMAMFFWKRATHQGALWSFLLGSGVTIIWYVIGSPYGIAPVFMGMPLSFIALVVISLATDAPTAEQLEGFYLEEEVEEVI